MMGTRLEGDEQAAATRSISCLVESDNLGVRSTECGVVTLSDQLSIRIEHDRTNHWVG